MARETMKVSRPKIFDMPQPEIMTTWSVDERHSEPNGYTVTLRIHGHIYKMATDKESLTKAYRKLLEDICPALSRSVTIARLMGGEL